MTGKAEHSRMDVCIRSGGILTRAAGRDRIKNKKE